ncbi:MAG: Lrp/AsnC family transcriptional regulator [Pacificimonas sp.]|jgi:DNA-binding Lrp family transcriptional regulator|nr:Lrp/AsnC family transcriptional regulator [Pacificimonas sp.]
MKVSAKDELLLNLLRDNARQSIASLARALGVSRTTVGNRIDRLIDRGVIERFTIKTGHDYDSHRIEALVNVSVIQRETASVVAQLKQLPALKKLIAVSGQYDLFAEISAGSTAEIDQILDTISAMTGVERTSSAIVLSVKLQR